MRTRARTRLFDHNKLVPLGKQTSHVRTPLLFDQVVFAHLLHTVIIAHTPTSRCSQHVFDQVVFARLLHTVVVAHTKTYINWYAHTSRCSHHTNRASSIVHILSCVGTRLLTQYDSTFCRNSSILQKKKKGGSFVCNEGQTVCMLVFRSGPSGSLSTSNRVYETPIVSTCSDHV